VNWALFGEAGNQEDEGLLSAEHKLALSVEAALVLYRHAHKAMRIAHYRLMSVHGGAGEAGTTSVDADRATVLAASRAVLLCCADCGQAWACRESLLRYGALDSAQELLFNAMLLRTNHKSGESWASRRALLALSVRDQNAEGLEQRYATELALVEELARKYDHHYYAWNHWAWVERLCFNGSAHSLVGSSFPRLTHVTPSHYGLFHHRIVRLRHQLVGGPVRCASEVGVVAAAGALQEVVLDAYAEERRLSDGLLATFAYLEAPWAFRAQLFAVLTEAIDPRLGGLDRIVDLWLSESRHAAPTEVVEDHVDKNIAIANNLRWRFRAHILQELAMLLRSAVVSAPGTTDRENVPLEASWKNGGPNKALLAELAELEAASGAPHGVLRSVRKDLNAVVA